MLNCTCAEWESALTDLPQNGEDLGGGTEKDVHVGEEAESSTVDAVGPPPHKEEVV